MTELELKECPICGLGFYHSSAITARDRVDQHVALDHPDWVKKSPRTWVKTNDPQHEATVV